MFDLSMFVQQYPILAQIVAVMVISRGIFKPLFTFLHSVADATPTQKDNAALAKVEASPVYKAIAFVLDWTLSIKLPAAK